MIAVHAVIDSNDWRTGEEVYRSHLNKSVKFGQNGVMVSPPQEATAEWRLSDRTGVLYASALMAEQLVNRKFSRRFQHSSCSDRQQSRNRLTHIECEARV